MGNPNSKSWKSKLTRLLVVWDLFKSKSTISQFHSLYVYRSIIIQNEKERMHRLCRGGIVARSLKHNTLYRPTSITKPFPYGRSLLNRQYEGKRLLTSPSPSSPLGIEPRPPLPMRIAIVGTSVGLCTPIYSVAGVWGIWYRYLPQSAEGLIFKYLLAFLMGGGGVTLLYKYVGPFLRDHSEFVLPFAIANGITASVLYGIADVAFGVESVAGSAAGLLGSSIPFLPATLARIPLGGPIIGTLTVFLSPFLWPLSFDLCWSKDMKLLLLSEDSTWLFDLYSMILLPVAAPIGFFAGLSSHYILRSTLLGTAGKHWTKGPSIPLLLSLCGGAGLYFSYFRSPEHWYTWEVRLDPLTGALISHNPVTGEIIPDGGNIGNKSTSVREWSNAFHKLHSDNLFEWLVDGISRRLPSQQQRQQQQQQHPKGRSLDGVPIDVSIMSEREALFGIMDILIRHRHLKIQDKSGINVSVEEKALKEMAKSLGIVGDLDALAELVEVAVILHRNMQHQQDQQQNLIAINSSFNSLVDRIENCMGSGANKTHSQSKFAASMLVNNLPLYEKELKRHINYTIAEKKGDEIKIIKDFESKVWTRESLPYIISLTGLAVLIFTALNQGA